MPHGHHRQHEPSSRSRGGGVPRAGRRRAPAGLRVVREIAAADAVVTTSLHGLVTADAFGIPATWTMLEPPLSGGAFKFHDYESVLTPGSSRFAVFDPGCRSASCFGLRRAE